MFTLFETIVLGILGIALMLTIIRLLKGPTVPDRILALDVLSMIAIGILGLYAVATEDSAPLDVAIGIALVAFLATAGLAHYYLTHHEAPSESEEPSAEKRPKSQ
ncbi:MAG: cation:proton antiporter [Opitutales bacterium]